MSKQSYVPLNKQTKKAQRAHYATQRADWNGVVPSTRVIPDKRRQDRQQSRNSLRRQVDRLEADV